MRIAATALQWLVRLAGVTQLALGALFWTGNQMQLIPVHMQVGLTLVVSLWALAILGWAAGVSKVRAVLALLWGLITIVLGFAQSGLLPGDLHFLVQVIHLLVGVAAIGQAEMLARGIKARTPRASLAGG
jgi:hypothetical protein